MAATNVAANVSSVAEDSRRSNTVRSVAHAPRISARGGGWRLRSGGRLLGDLRLLEDPDGVAERIAEAHVGAVEVVGGLLGEVGDAALLEGLVERPGVVGDEDEAAERALGDQLADLLRGRLVVQRRARLLERDLGALLAGDADRQPAVVALLDVVATSRARAC